MVSRQVLNNRHVPRQAAAPSVCAMQVGYGLLCIVGVVIINAAATEVQKVRVCLHVLPDVFSQ